MTIDEMITVLQAAKAGKQIQCSVQGSNAWFDMEPNWNFGSCDYRPKPPEPREWKVRLGSYGMYFDWETEPSQPVINVREVLP